MLRTLSLTTRLTLFFTVVVAAVVLGLGCLFVVLSDQHFIELDDAILAEKKHLIEDIVGSASSAEGMRTRLAESLSHHYGLMVRVVRVQDATDTQAKQGTQDTVLFETHTPAHHGAHSAASNPPVFDANSSQYAVNNHSKERRPLSDNGQFLSDFRSTAFYTHPAYAPSIQLHIVLALDTAHHQQFMHQLHRSLAVYALLAMLVSGLLGWLAAHHGMAPLRAMKSRAAGVTGQRLDARMPVQAVPIEMADLAQELNHMLARLQHDFHRLSEFSSDLAHELRTPISNLLTQTQVTLASQRPANTYRDILASNAEELQRLGRMVADMLFLAKTERGVDLPRKERFAAATEVQALIDFYEAVADEKNIQLTAVEVANNAGGTVGDGSGANASPMAGAANNADAAERADRSASATIVGDKLMFRRAISNLLSNALRHAPAGGQVRIVTTRQPHATQVTVENTGPDIPPQVLSRLFDRFYRADPARTHPESDGAGLGLSITQAIVQAHGGTASAISGGGVTRFTLVFPG